MGSVIRVDPALHASRGYNADLGWRGTLGGALKFDAAVFYLRNRDRVGIRTREDASGEFEESANIGTSVHRGIETYLEIDPFSLAGIAPTWGTMDLFTSIAFVDARYVTGEFKGKRVEQAPRIVDRTGISYLRRGFIATAQASYTSRSFGDANNTLAPLEDAAAGVVPSYLVFDFAVKAPTFAGHEITAGVNNLANRKYFTKRTGEYPGPGILPGQARSVYLGLQLKL
jgi:Fe(3+) dicitrate transport protein